MLLGARLYDSDGVTLRRSVLLGNQTVVFEYRLAAAQRDDLYAFF